VIAENVAAFRLGTVNYDLLGATWDAQLDVLRPPHAARISMQADADHELPGLRLKVKRRQLRHLQRIEPDAARRAFFKVQLGALDGQLVVARL
jgi:hypothetical protein